MDFENKFERLMDAFGVWNEGVKQEQQITDKILSEKHYQYTKHQLRDLIIEIAQKGINGNTEELREIVWTLKKVE